jgi:hypothetical protein
MKRVAPKHPRRPERSVNLTDKAWAMLTKMAASWGTSRSGVIERLVREAHGEKWTPSSYGPGGGPPE